jgi:hypothetical protein
MRLLNLLGVDIGPAEDLTHPTEFENPRGYWEPRWLLDLNDEILARLDTVWWRPLDAEPGWEHRSDLEPLREQARRLLQEKFGSAGLWGWKEPRTTLTLPFWRELVPDARYVICLRNPVDAISSFQRRPEPNLSVGTWGELWLEYTARALEQTRESPRLLVFYEDLLRDGRYEVVRLASFLGQAPPKEQVIRGILDEIDPNIRHHATSSQELAVAWGIAPAIRTLFLALRAARDIRRADSGSTSCDATLPQAIERVVTEVWAEQRLTKVYKEAAEDRLALVEDLSRIDDERLKVINELQEAADERLKVISELQEAADGRLKVMNELQEAADERLKVINHLQEEADERARQLELAKRSRFWPRVYRRRGGV